MRGHDEPKTSANHGNLVALMEEVSKDDKKLKAKWPINYYCMHKSDAKSLSTSICETTEKFGVDFMMWIAECSDGISSVMNGEFNGVQVRFKKKVPCAVYVHCHGHRLNLILTDYQRDIIKLPEFFSLV